MLYNILLPINQYSGNNTINAIAEAMSDIREFQWLFHQIISSDVQDHCISHLVFHQIF